MTEPAGARRLEIYQLAHAQALRIDAMSWKLPKHENFEEGQQIRRSSKSVASQIIEGYRMRKYKGEYLHLPASGRGVGRRNGGAPGFPPSDRVAQGPVALWVSQGHKREAPGQNDPVHHQRRTPAHDSLLLDRRHAWIAFAVTGGCCLRLAGPAMVNPQSPIINRKSRGAPVTIRP